MSYAVKYKTNDILSPTTMLKIKQCSAKWSKKLNGVCKNKRKFIRNQSRGTRKKVNIISNSFNAEINKILGLN